MALWRGFIFSSLLVLAMAQDTCYRYNSYYGSYYTNYCSGYCTGPLGSENCITYYTESGGGGITIGASVGGSIGGIFFFLICICLCSKTKG